MSTSYDKDKIARRRWRNMMIAAMAGHRISDEKRDYLDKMRRELGISIDRAREIVDQYRMTGGGITLFGDQFQRIQVFRDIINMLLAGGDLDEKGRALLLKIASRLEISEEEIEEYIAEARAALAVEDMQPPALSSSESQRLSRRIFRRIVSEDDKSNELLKQYDSLERSQRRTLELEVLEKLAHKKDERGTHSPESSRQRRYRYAYLEDQRCAALLIDRGVITEEQAQPYRDLQQRMLESEGLVVSFLTEMVRAKVLDKTILRQTREEVRRNHPEEEPMSWTRHTEGRNGGLELEYHRVTLDQTFRVGYIKLRGYLDHDTFAMLQEVFDSLFANRDDAGRLIVLDLEGVEYISSAGVGAILNARAQVLERWGDIRFLNVSPEAQEIFSLIGVDQMLVFCDDLEEALWSFSDLAGVRNINA